MQLHRKPKAEKKELKRLNKSTRVTFQMKKKSKSLLKTSMVDIIIFINF